MEGLWLSDFSLAEPPAGYAWRLGPAGGPYLPVAAGRVTGFTVAAVSSGLRPDVEAYVSGPGGASAPVRLRLTYPPAALPVIVLAGGFSATGGERVGEPLAFVLPTATSPQAVTMAIAAACYDSADASAPMAVLPAGSWTTPASVTAGLYVSYVLTVSAPGLPSVILATPRRLIQAAAEPRPTLAEVFTPALAETQAAMEHILRAYKVDASFGGNSEGPAIQNVYAHCPVPLLALEAFSGQSRALTSAAFQGARIGQSRLLDHMRYWLNGRAPAGRSGYNAQYEAQFVAAAAILRATPAVWSLMPGDGGLTAAEKVRLDLVMKGCAVGSLWVLSDQNPYANGTDPGNERTVRGYKAQRGGVPNFSLPVRLIPFVVDGYMRLDGTTLQAWLATFDRDVFAAEVAAAGGLADLHDTYRQTWTLAVMRAAHPGAIESYGPGPDKAMLHAALRDGFAGGVYRGLGLTLEQSSDMFVGEFTRFFSKVVRPGPGTHPVTGAALPGRETDTPPWNTGGYGLKTSSPLSGIDITQLRGVLGSAFPDGTTSKAAWAGLPNPGALGMMAELDTMDGGGGGNPPVRSCTTYTFHGAAALANLTAAAAVLGRLDRADLADGGLPARISVGVTDFLYRTEHGHREYSKGAQEHPNYDWSRTWIEAQNARFETWAGMWRMVEAWLAA